MNTKNLMKEKEYTLEESNLPLANGMLLHNDHISNSKRSSLTAPTVLKYPRGG